MANLITLLVIGPMPVTEPPVALPDPSADDPGDVQQCEWLYDDSTLAGAIHLDMFGTHLQCDQLATHSGVMPAPTAEEPDFLVQLCARHYTEAQAEGLRDAVTL